MMRKTTNGRRRPVTTRAGLRALCYALFATVWLAAGGLGLLGIAGDQSASLALGWRLVAALAFLALTGTLVFAVAYRLIARFEKPEPGETTGAPAERSLFDQHPAAVFELDRECRLVHLNPIAGRMLGRTPEEVIGSGLDAIAAPERVEPDMEHLRATLRGQARMFDSIGVASDGRNIGVQVTSIPKLVEGRVAGIYAIVKNVDAERRMQEQLAAGEARLRAILENSMDAIWLSDPFEGRLLECNRAAEELFGRSEAELKTLRRERVFDMDRSDLSEFIRQREDKGHARGILYLIRPDGRRVPVEASSGMFQNARGQWRSSVTLRDISERQRQEAELGESEQRYRALFEQSADAILLSRPDGSIDHANPAAERMFRCSVDELRRLGRSNLVDEQEPAFQALRKERQSSNRARGEIHMRRAGGEWFLAEINVVAFEDESGQTGISVVVHDVTETRELQRQIELLATAFRSANEALLVCDLEWRVLDANEAYQDMVGLGREQIIGQRPSFLQFGTQFEKILRDVESEGQWRGELLLRDAEGTLKTARGGLSEIRGSNGAGRFMVVNLEDISRMREIQRRVDFLSYNDSLTGLPNRSALQQWYVERSSPPEAPEGLAVVYLDLDRFKAINESFGHSTGDEILIEVGRRLTAHCKKTDFVARLGGDDFVVVLTEVGDERDAQQRTEHLIRQLAVPIESGDQKIFSSASAGIVFCAGGGEELEDLLRRADAAHATAKRHGRGQFQVYDHSMQREVEEHALVETHLREAIRQGELYLVYQPMVDLDSGGITGLEALVRWDNPELGAVPPARFVPVAEASGLIVELGAWIFDQACVAVRNWLDAGIEFGSVAVNISPVQFQQRDFADQIAKRLKHHGVAGHHFFIEITENILMLDPERAAGILQKLHDLGLCISVDDFGTGYSSKAYLRQFPVHCLKLDQSFVQSIPGSRVDSTVTRSIIDLAAALDLKLVAEGIETEQQRTVLLQWGCTQGQGYLFSKPGRIAGITDMLRAEMPLKNGVLDVAQDDTSDPEDRR